MRRYDTITFDMGYTLVYFYPSENALYLRAFHEAGLDPDPSALERARNQVYREFFGQAANTIYEPSEERDRTLEAALLRETLTRVGYDGAALAPQLMPTVRATFRQPGAVHLFPEVLDVLHSLRARGCTLGIISNWNWDLHDFVRLAGITDYFGAIVASARAGCDKPHPSIFLQALSALGGSPERALHVGDSYGADVIGARGVGMDALWLDRAGEGGHLDCPTIRDLTGVLPLIEA